MTVDREVIASRANAHFKQLRQWAESGQRQRRDGVALLEGVHLAEAFLSSPRDKGRVVRYCVVSDAAVPEPIGQEVTALVERVRQRSVPGASGARVLRMDAALFAQLMPGTHGGAALLLVIDVPEATLASGLASGDGATASKAATGAMAHGPLERVVTTCVILDAVQDAGNAGSILRSAAAAGVTRAFCMPGTAGAWSSKVLRAAMGAHFATTITEMSGAPDAAADALIAALDVPIAITDSHAATTIYDCNLRGAVAWVFGNEGAGVSARWREAAQYRLTIPQVAGVESLNVAAAAAVCLFEQARQAARP